MSSLTHNNAITQAGNVYLKKANTFDRFQWGGRVMRLDEGTENLGGVSVSTQLNPRGGLELDNILLDAPGSTDFQIVMKQAIADRTKTQLKTCFWHVDRRTHCGDGRDRDDPFAWEEITRYWTAKATGRTTPMTTWEGEEDALINIPFSGLQSFDIYKVEYTDFAAISAGAFSLVDVDVCHPGHCPGCTDEEDCVVVAVGTLIAAGSPNLMVNTAGGDLSAGNWSSVTITEWTVAGATRVLCLGNLLVITSTGESECIRSDDRGTTRTQVGSTVMAVNAPISIDGLDSTFIIVGAQVGWVYASYDAGRTWEALSQGDTISQDVNAIMIARDNPTVIYAVGNANAIMKSTNSGETWVALTGPSAADALLELWVTDQNHLLVVNDDGEIWESSDGGVTWTQQERLASIPAIITSASISSAGADVYYLTATDDTDTVLFRNVEGGAAGYWEPIITSNPLQIIKALIACDPNRAVAVGGNGSTTNLGALIN